MLILTFILSLFFATDDLPDKWEHMLEYLPNGVYTSISFNDYEEMGKSEYYRLNAELRKEIKVSKRSQGSMPKELSDRLARSISGRVLRLEINERKVHKITERSRELISGGFPDEVRYPKGATAEEKTQLDKRHKMMKEGSQKVEKHLSAFISSMSRVMVAEVNDKEELLQVLKEKGLIEEVEEGKEIKGFQVYKLNKYRSRNVSKSYFITFLADGKTLLLADYFSQLLAMLDSGAGNIISIKEGNSFKEFLNMGIKEIDQKFSISFREDSNIEQTLSHYLRNKIEIPECVVEMTRKEIRKRSPILEVRTTSYSEICLSKDYDLFFNENALGNWMEIKKIFLEQDRKNSKSFKIFSMDSVIVVEIIQDKAGMIKDVERTRKFFKKKLEQEKYQKAKANKGNRK